MNRRMILSTVGMMMTFESILLVIPIIVALIFHEATVHFFLISAGIALFLGLIANLVSKPKTKVIYAREGFIIVSLSWIMLSLIGALPFFISGQIPNYIDAVFESVSGFTTTGASILDGDKLEAMSKSMLFWRALIQWMGGMGVLVFVAAILPGFSDRTVHILRAEMPGPIFGKQLPRAKDTASFLYKIYIAMTLVQIFLLLAGRMPVFDSIVLSFSSASTGGFGIRSDSIASYSPYCQWVITIFMLLFGVNFNLYYLLLTRRFKAARQSEECWYYLGFAGISIALISTNIYRMYGSLSETVRASAFQVASLITSTGYSTVDFDLWPQFSKTLLVIIMLIGACAGSTGGGMKISRVVILIKMYVRELKHMVRPRSVNSIRFEGKTIDGTTVKNISSYLVIYSLCIIIITLILGVENHNFETDVTAVISCFNNMGPGMALAGPTESYSFFSPVSKIALSFAMLLGRLEIMPMLILFSPITWRKK